MQSAVIMRKVCSAHCLRPRLRFVHSETDHMLLILGFERARRGATPKETCLACDSGYVLEVGRPGALECRGFELLASTA